MGLLDAIKKVLKPGQVDGHDASAPVLANQEVVSGNAVVRNRAVDAAPVDVGSRTALLSAPRTSLTPHPAIHRVPPDVLRLLWFRDGPWKNIDPEQRYVHKTEHFTIKVSFLGSIEPSAIGVNDAVRPPKDGEPVERPPYYPTYERMTPEQRWVYLCWLMDVDKEVNIGYVFVFYYGLERHLFFDRYEEAFEMVLRLRRVHRNGSFLGYSASAMIAACIIHNRPDLFERFLKSPGEVADEDVNTLYLLAKRSLGLDLGPREVMLLAKEVGFSNKRYLEGEEALFEAELRRQMLKVLGRESIDLRPLSLNDTPSHPVVISANFSLREDQRLVNVPDLSQNKAFRELVLRLLQEAHEAVKLQLKEVRKEERTSPSEKLGEPEQTISCPYCGAPVKTPQSKRVCPTCKRAVFARTDPDTKARVFVTEEGAARLDARKRDLQVIRYAVKCMWPYGMTGEQIEETFAELRKTGYGTVNDAVWRIVKESMRRWEAEGTVPSQYCYLAMANFLEFEGKDKSEMMAKYEREDMLAMKREENRILRQ